MIDIKTSISYKESVSQYDALKKTWRYLQENSGLIKDIYKTGGFKTIIFSGCGSSFYVSRSTAVSASLRLKEKSLAMAAGDIMINHPEYEGLMEDVLLVLVSRSGSTSEALLAAGQVKKRGGKVLSIICTEGSKLAALSDFVFEIPWAFDESVCQTRTVTNLYAANLCIIGIWSGDEKLLEDIETAIDRGEEFIGTWEQRIQDAASGSWNHVFVLADGELEGIAEEGALAFKEICGTHSNYYHVLDVRHGPVIGITSETLVIIAVSPNDSAYQKDLIGDIIKRGGKAIIYSPEEIAPVPGVALQVSSGLPLGPAAAGIPFIFISQMAALTHAAVMGIDPDKPSGLDPWIKL